MTATHQIKASIPQVQRAEPPEQKANLRSEEAPGVSLLQAEHPCALRRHPPSFKETELINPSICNHAQV